MEGVGLMGVKALSCLGDSLRGDVALCSVFSAEKIRLGGSRVDDLGFRGLGVRGLGWCWT